MHDIYLKEFIFSYDRLNEILDNLVHSNYYMTKITKHNPIGRTMFGYPIEHYTIGNGYNHVILLAGTHGCEIVTVYFLLEVIHSLLYDDELYNKIKDKYTFHIIPVHNPEGFVISTSQIMPNIKNMGIDELENFAKEYLEKYNYDYEESKDLAKAKKKLHRTMMECSMDFMPNYDMSKRVSNILKSCSLKKDVLTTWSSNGVGIDPNANSIHQFSNMEKYIKENKYGDMVYNDIPIYMPSPTNYPGEKSLDINCPENTALYDFIQSLYKYNLSGSVTDKLVAIFSYHSTGGKIYGHPDSKYSNTKQCILHKDAMKRYAKITEYEIVENEQKYDVMDFYRIVLNNVVSLTIELSKLNGNPIRTICRFGK